MKERKYRMKKTLALILCAGMLSGFLGGISPVKAKAEPYGSEGVEAREESRDPQQSEPILSVRVPTVVTCVVTPTGEVIEPNGYAIENLSQVDVTTTLIEATGQSPNTTIELLDGDETVWSTDRDGTGFSIRAGASKPLTWKVHDLDGSRNADLLSSATTGPAKLVDVFFEFEEA